MKYFTIFLILIVLVNASGNCEVKNGDNGKHCTKCEECNPDVCDTCEEGYAKENELTSEDCTICAPGYSMTSDNVCVKCDDNCDMTSSGCADQGKKLGAGHCDSKCNFGWGLVKVDGKTNSYKCLECDGGCSSGCDQQATEEQKSDKCDSECTALTHVFVADKHECEKCDPHCADGCEGFTKSHQCKSKCVARYTYVSERDEDPCQACDPNCKQCDSEEAGAGKCDANGEKDDYCDDGWVLKRSTMTCVQCDPNCIDGCKAEGEGKCKSTCKDGYYWDSTTKTCIECLTNCGKCDGAYDCDACNPGYYLIDATSDKKETKDDPDQCLKIDCKPVDPNCEICVGANRDQLKCTKCKTGYEFEYDRTYHTEEEEERYRCVDITKTIECTIKSETEGVEDKKEYGRKDKCYTEHLLHSGSDYDYYHKYFKYVQNGADTMKCYYIDEDCIYREQIADEKTFNTCTKLDENKYILHDSKCSGHKMYSDSTCKTELKNFDSNKCFKIDTHQHVYITTEQADSYVQYYGEDCDGGDTDKSRIIYKDKECVKVNSEKVTCVWPTDSNPEPTPDPLDETCEVKNCKEGKCSEDKKTCDECISGYTISEDKKTCNKNPDGSNNDDGSKDGSIMNIIMLTILIISLMI